MEREQPKEKHQTTVTLFVNDQIPRGFFQFGEQLYTEADGSFKFSTTYMGDLTSPADELFLEAHIQTLPKGDYFLGINPQDEEWLVDQANEGDFDEDELLD